MTNQASPVPPQATTRSSPATLAPRRCDSPCHSEPHPCDRLNRPLPARQSGPCPSLCDEPRPCEPPPTTATDQAEPLHAFATPLAKPSPCPRDLPYRTVPGRRFTPALHTATSRPFPGPARQAKPGSGPARPVRRSVSSPPGATRQARTPPPAATVRVSPSISGPSRRSVPVPSRPLPQGDSCYP